MIRFAALILLWCGAAAAQQAPPPQTAGELQEHIAKWRQLKENEIKLMNERDRAFLEKQKEPPEKAAKP